MAGQHIKQGNIFGRLGSGIGQGIAETLPKEIERGRLSQGLQQLGQQQNLSPFQQFSALSSLPGVTPQMIQSGTELLKQRGLADAYARSSDAYGRNGQGEQRPNLPASSQPSFKDVQFGQKNQMPPSAQVDNRQRTPNVRTGEDIPQVIPGNAFNQKNVAALPSTPKERNAAISEYIKQGFTPEQSQQLFADDEQRRLREPEVHKQRQEDIKTAKGDAREALKRHLETKLQKTGENVFRDVEGPMILNAERGMIRDLIQNPNQDVDNVANDWSERLYRTAVAKGKLRTLSQTTGLENLFKGDSFEKKLKEYQQIFKRSGNLEEFYNILQQKSSSDQTENMGFGMSPQGAASAAFPPSKKIEKYLSSIKSSSVPVTDPDKARKAALDIESVGLDPDDSILAIAKKLSDKDPFFDQQAFIDQISEDKDLLGLNERQRLELAEGARNILPNWNDLLYLPFFRR